MSQAPPQFKPQISFSTLAQQPITRSGLPGAQIDAEFSRVSASINSLVNRLGEIQRDDGRLKDGIVDVPQLSTQVRAILSAAGARIRGSWLPGTVYKVGDFVSVLKPAFAVTGAINPDANGNYYMLGYTGGAPTFGKDGLSNFVFKVEQFIDGPLGPYGSRWKLYGPVTTLYGLTVSGVTSPAGANGFYVQKPELFAGRNVYALPGNLGFDAYVIRYSGVRWECLNGAGVAIFQATPGNSNTPFGLTWAEAGGWGGGGGTGPFTPGSGITTQAVASTTRVLVYATVGGADLPWSVGAWTYVHASGAIVATRYSGASGLANSSYIAVADHTSAPQFETNAALWGLVAAPEATNNLAVDSFTGDGVALSFVLSAGAASVNNTQVYINGVYQSKAKYNLDGDVITFTPVAGPPANGAAVEVVCGIATEINVTALSEGAVGTSKVQSFAITEAKMADNAVTARVLAIGSVEGNKLAENSVTANHLGAGCVTTEKLSANSVTTSILENGSVTADKISDNAVGAQKIANGAITSVKLASGPLTLNGTYTPTQPAHVVTKDYLERNNSVSQAMIANGAINGSKLADNSITPSKYANSWSQPMHIRQALKSGVQVVVGTASSWTDVADLEFTITRAKNTGRVRIEANIMCASNSDHPLAFRVLRGATVVGVGTGSGSRMEVAAAGGANAEDTELQTVCIDFIDGLPGITLEAITYKIQCRIPTGSTGYINRSVTDPNDATGIRAVSTLTLTELSS